MVNIQDLLTTPPKIPKTPVYNIGTPDYIQNSNRQPYGELRFYKENGGFEEPHPIPIGLPDNRLNTYSCAYSGLEMRWNEHYKYNGGETKELLDYFMVTNSLLPGIIRLKLCRKLLENNVLISSSQLTGCTACALHLRKKDIILFYHVGGNGVTYSTEAKNRDLLNAILSDISSVYTYFDFGKYYANSTIDNINLIKRLSTMASDISLKDPDFQIVCQIYMKRGNIAENDIGKEYYELPGFFGCIGLYSYSERGCLVTTVTNNFQVYYLSRLSEDVFDFKLKFSRALIT